MEVNLLPLTDRKYKTNQAILKDYGGKFFKLTAFKCLRTCGIEESTKKQSKGTINEKKLDENISRARATVFEYATCNHWTFWSTFTLDSKKYDRSNLEKFRQDFSQFMRNQGKKLKCKIDYLLVPELHKDGKNWHMHGFIEGLPLTELKLFDQKQRIPKALKEKLKNGDLVYDWTAYREKFGFNDLEYVRNQEACSKYITKYFSKDISKDIQSLGAHLYYCSKGLKKALELKRGTIVSAMIPDYENEYVRVQVFKQPASVEALKLMIL